jgi:hypothetical protein
MTEDKKIYERPQRQLWEKEIEGSSNDIVFEFFQTNDKECIYSKGYPGGINFEFYPNKKKLNILYPFPTFKELTELGVELYCEHEGHDWQSIAPGIELDWCDEGDGTLYINESLHNALIKFFISELRYKEDSWEFDGKKYFEKNSGLQNYMDNNFAIEYLFRKIPSNLESYLFTADDFSAGLFDGINLCNWTVQKKFNENGYLDVEVSIDLPKFHNEVCRDLCCKEANYGIDYMFGYVNGVDGRRDDGKDYGVYTSIDLDGIYGSSHEIEVEFPWNRNS